MSRRAHTWIATAALTAVGVLGACGGSDGAGEEPDPDTVYVLSTVNDRILPTITFLDSRTGLYRVIIADTVTVRGDGFYSEIIVIGQSESGYPEYGPALVPVRTEAHGTYSIRDGNTIALSPGQANEPSMASGNEGKRYTNALQLNWRTDVDAMTPGEDRLDYIAVGESVP